jgi:SAM-dependent methyltransferase
MTMSAWDEGYVSDIDYTYGYYAELNPQRLKLAFLHQGLAFPEIGAACELGFGQGLSANIHAAASVTQWCGTDFNPSQAGFAQELAAASGANAQLLDEAFAEFANRSDLPDFDYIGLHGIWSWISDQNRSVIVDFIRRKLKVGGVLYISYNTQPGWAAMVPMRELLTEHAHVMGAQGTGIVSQIDAALNFADQVIATNPAYARVNPEIANRLKQIKEQSRNYVAHEYFNRDWLPMSFTQIAKWLAPAKLDFACSANYLDHIDAINLTTEQQALLASVPDPMFRQTVRDFMINQQFRKDYWVKGARKLSAGARVETLRDQRFLLQQHRPGIPLTVAGALGKADLQEAVYTPILDLLSSHQSMSLGEMEHALKGQVSLTQLIQAVMILTGGGWLLHVQATDDLQQASKACAALNLHIQKRARFSSDISYLASPVSGGGVAVTRFDQLFLLARSMGLPESEWVGYVWKNISAQGHKLLKDGKPLDSVQDNLSELGQYLQDFTSKRLPIFQALAIA